MKKVFGAAPVFVLIVASVLFLANSGGSPGGKTGSPGDVASCATNGGCHGPKTPERLSLLASTVPETGYVPGQEYQITISATKPNVNRYGFEIVSESSLGSALGTFIDSDEVNATNNRATHKFQSINGVGGNTWTLDWTAPLAGSGDVKFYVAVLAANGNGTTSGDNVLLDNITIEEGQAASIANLQDINVVLYPNPTDKFLRIDGVNLETSKLSVIDRSGRVVLNSAFSETIDVSFLAAGNYYLVVENGNWVLKKPFIKR